MKRWWLVGLLLVGLEVLLFQVTHRAQTPPRSTSTAQMPAPSVNPSGNPSGNSSVGGMASPAPNPAETIRYETYTLPQATAHVLTIPSGSGAIVRVGVASGGDSLENFVRSSGAIGGINGGYFDPENLLSTSYVVQQGQLVADPKLNDRLMQNPNLAPYMDKILNRSEFRRYQCEDGVRYAITPQNEATPAGCQLVDGLGGGPQLLPALTLEQEGFLAVENGTVIRDAIGYSQPNARSAIGLTEQGDVVLVMVAKQPNNPSNSGISLPALAEFMKTLGVTQALNLDGGGSSSLYYDGKTILGSVDNAGNPVGRSVKSVLLVVPPTP